MNKDTYIKTILRGRLNNKITGIWMADDSVCSSTHHDESSYSKPVQRNAGKSATG